MTTPQNPSPTTSSDPPSSPSTSSPVILYKPPTLQKLLRTAAINLVLPFINGLMLGFGELFAHEVAFRWGWGGTRVFPASRGVAPGVEVGDVDGGDRRGRGDRGRERGVMRLG
ncbi:TOM13-domain-containing protein [Choiromyces venosus 120613-1]|uniref:TOM13-domain-containing protein n=1 Tax=Choiromyces venosus 120613-1 TaxID=1336337 RepID=A0A3N4K273_9PEZI|nr:TOM13-domain-containing protein [Choiromyces venosus 120613-1]